jgi:hypothetical protein
LHKRANWHQRDDFTWQKGNHNLVFGGTFSSAGEGGGGQYELVTPIRQPLLRSHGLKNQMAQGPAGIAPGDFGVPNYTAIVSAFLTTLAYRGDFADTIEALSGAGLIPDNVGMGSQFSEFTYYTNKRFSSYNGLLATLHKNAGHGLQFDLVAFH